ncbi:MAG: ribonuclease III [Firmicutes bacterium]|nr:ribonuclease III [Bacillota bacterium]
MMISKAEKLIGYAFKDRDLLETALTHSSYANDYLGDSRKGNERLEFLGDAVLDAVMALELFRRFPEKDEGYLTKIRAEIVCEKALGEAAMALGLNDCIQLGKGEEAKGGRTRLSIVSDAAEAVIAAVYLDGGPEAAKALVKRLLEPTLEAAAAGQLPSDYKTELQIYCQKHGHQAIRYEITAEHGPDHDKSFSAQVLVDGKVMGAGEGHTKKQAQIQAAGNALRYLEENGVL